MQVANYYHIKREMVIVMKRQKLKFLSVITASVLLLTLLTGKDNITVLQNSAATGAEASLFNELPVDTKIGKRDLSAEYLIPMGTAFGIKLYSDGAIVTRLQEVLSEDGFCCPAAEAGIMAGDYIIAANGRKITSNLEFKTVLATDISGILEITLRRNGEEMTVFLEPVTDSTGKKCGMWIRDSAAGIGTLTFCDPETGYFGGLGHGICDGDTGELIPMDRGSVLDVKINGIKKGATGAPGEIKGYFCSGKTGTLISNTNCGVYGVLGQLPSSLTSEPIPIGGREELKDGGAYILCTLDDSGPQKYSIRISDINRSANGNKCFTVTVTDKALIDKTGGIVQGMSGSPIIQNGKLVGAVTHVLINDPATGYGIFIENMLNAANIPQARAS